LIVYSRGSNLGDARDWQGGRQVLNNWIKIVIFALKKVNFLKLSLNSSNMDSDFNLLTGLIRVYTIPTPKFFQNFLVGGAQVFLGGTQHL
jgi:hypothetical protein